MVTIKNKQQKWVITKSEYYQEKAIWDSRGTVEIEPKPEYDLQTEVEIKPIKKDAKKKTKQ